MSDVRDRYVIDQMIMEDNKLVLLIIDTLQWDCCVREQHARILQDKINDYLQFIDSGQIVEHHTDKEYDSIVIRIMAQYSYSRYCLDFLERCRKWIGENGNLCGLEWTHFTQDEEETEFDDGFSDDYVFEPEKIYPRLKKNWAKKPLETVTLMASYSYFNNEEESSEYDNVPMFRVFDSYVIVIMQDVGSTYLCLSYDNIPAGTPAEQLQQKAFENLQRDITYRMVESKEPGVYGLAAGGDFEAESLCLPGIWEDCSDELQDDLLIAVPTKDLVLFTRASDKKLIRKMVKLAQKTFERNRKESPFLIFSRDIFCYNREERKLEISRKYNL